MPGGIQVFARALNMTTQELFKAMENGELLAGEVLPAVAEEMRRTARNNDALAKSLMTSRSQWAIFVNNFKLLFDGFGSTLLDRGIARFTQALGDLLKVIKPVAQAFFGLLGVVFSLVGELGKGILIAFKPILNIFKALEKPINDIKDSLLGVDFAFMEWFGHLAKFVAFLHPILRAFLIIGGIIEEVINIFTGHAQGVLAGEGDTFSERFANGMLGRLIPMWDKWWEGKFIPYIKKKADELALIFKEALKSIFPEWMWAAGPAISNALNPTGQIQSTSEALGVEGFTSRNILTNPLGGIRSTLSGIDSWFQRRADQVETEEARQRRLQDRNVDFIPGGHGIDQFNIYMDGEKKIEQVIDRRTQQDLKISYE